MCAEHTLKTPPPGEDLLRYPDSGLLFDSLPLGIVFQNPQGEITRVNPAAETLLGLTIERLRLSEQKYRSLVENSSDCIWETDPQGRFTYLSPGFQNVTGYSPANFLGKQAHDIPHEEAPAEQVHEEMLAVMAHPRRLMTTERQIRHPDGHPVTVEVRATPVFGPDGDYRGMQGITQDITARKQVETARNRLNEMLHQSEQRLRAVLNNLLVGIMAADERRRIIFANDFACRMLGYSREELLAMTVDQLHPPRHGGPDHGPLHPGRGRHQPALWRHRAGPRHQQAAGGTNRWRRCC